MWWPLADYLCKHAGDHSVTTEECSSPHLTCLGLCGMAAWKLNGAICSMIQFRQVNGTFGRVIFTVHLPNGQVHSIWNFEAWHVYCTSILLLRYCVNSFYKALWYHSLVSDTNIYSLQLPETTTLEPISGTNFDWKQGLIGASHGYLWGEYPGV